MKESTGRTLGGTALGGLAGCVAKFSTYPLERVKTMIQVNEQKFSIRTTLALATRIVQRESMFGLWKGCAAGLLRTFPYIGISYGTFEYFESAARSLTDDRRLSRFLGGGLSGTTAVVFTYPMDVLRVRMAVTHRIHKYKDTTLQKYEGKAWLFRGMGPTLIGSFPYAAISFGTFHTLKAHFTGKSGDDKLSAGERFFCGAAAGTSSQTLTYPIDTVRKMMQTDSFLERSGEKKTDHGARSMRETISYIWRSQGVPGFYKGVGLNVVKGAISAAISFSANDFLRHIVLDRDTAVQEKKASA